MNVIGHQAIADQFHPLLFDALLQQIEVDAGLSITFEDEATRIAALRNVMRNAWSYHTNESNHSSPCCGCIRRQVQELPADLQPPIPLQQTPKNDRQLN
jgi:hypothetical protein